MRIDTDILVPTPDSEALKPWLPAPFVDYIETSGYNGPDCDDMPLSAGIAWRDDIPQPFGPVWLGDHLDATQTDRAILRSGFRPESIHQPDLAAASARAANRWLAETWLSADDRMRGSLVVPGQLTDLAVPVLEEAAETDAFVQVELPVRSREPYGNRRYWPLLRAAAERGLVVCLTPGGSPGNPPTPSGWPASFVEEVTDWSAVYQSQVVSLVFEGAFAEIPDLRVTLAGSGVTWVPALCWRFDKEWKGLRQHTPWVQKEPSAILRDCIRFTTTPFDVPDDRETLRELMEQLPGGIACLLHGSGLPRSFTRDGTWLLDRLEGEEHAAVAGEQAVAWYPRLAMQTPGVRG